MYFHHFAFSFRLHRYEFTCVRFIRLHINFSFCLSSNQELFDGSLQLNCSLVYRYYLIVDYNSNNNKYKFILHNFYLNSCERFRKIPRIKQKVERTRKYLKIVNIDNNFYNWVVTKESNQINATRRYSAFILCKPNKGNFYHFFLFESTVCFLFFSKISVYYLSAYQNFWHKY